MFNFYLFKNYFLVITFIFTIFFFFGIFFPNEAFAMEPSDLWTTNYYGDKEYIGPNAYTHFHPDPAPNIDNIQSSVSKPYGPILEDDWYENKKESDYIHSTKSSPHKHGNIYNYIRRVSFYYLWKIHYSEYNGYKDFKKYWDPSSNIRKEILKDIKSDFKFRNK
jgi:hypothetical protein